MKKPLALLGIAVIFVASLAVLYSGQTLQKMEKTDQVLVGVAFCGNSVVDGKLLIDKIKNYTNLFVLQSGTLQRDFKSVDELGDYAISKGLKFLPYFGMILPEFSSWLTNATRKWGPNLVGVYYSDEPGGKMLDDYKTFIDSTTGAEITKTTYGDILVQNPNGTNVVYEIGGNIRVLEQTGPTNYKENIYVTFYPDSTVKAFKPNPVTLTNDPIDYAPATTYAELLDAKPLKDPNDIANRFVKSDQNSIKLIKNSTKIFTSDYALYWFDYLSGYDVVLAQIGWNNSLSQQIAFERGAAQLQQKDWGIIITWKQDQSPYLASGEEIYRQMETAYNCGAKYIVLFNYYENQNNPYGSMEEEHFKALNDFWNKYSSNPKPQKTTAEKALILPQNYACAFRWKEDKIWGVIQPNQTSNQIFDLINKTIEINTFNYDIVFNDPKFLASSSYPQTLYWNQTK